MLSLENWVANFQVLRTTALTNLTDFDLSDLHRSKIQTTKTRYFLFKLCTTTRSKAVAD